MLLSLFVCVEKPERARMVRLSCVPDLRQKDEEKVDTQAPPGPQHVAGRGQGASAVQRSWMEQSVAMYRTE